MPSQAGRSVPSRIGWTDGSARSIAALAPPILGAILFSYLQIKLLSSPALRDSYLFLYGGLLMLIMLFEPKGLVGLLRRLRQALARAPSKRLPDAG